MRNALKCTEFKSAVAFLERHAILFWTNSAANYDVESDILIEICKLHRFDCLVTRDIRVESWNFIKIQIKEL